MLLLTLPRPLVAPALVAPFAVLVAGVGAQVPADAPVPMLVATLVLLGLGRVGVTVPSTPLWVSSLVAATFGWLYLLGSGLGQVIDDQTVAHLWGHGAVWPLLAAVAVASAAAPVIGLGRVPTLVGYSVAALVGTFVAVAPALDNTLTGATVSLLLCVLAWSAVATFAPEGLRPPPSCRWPGQRSCPSQSSSTWPGPRYVPRSTSVRRSLRPSACTSPTSSPWVSPWLAAPTLVTLAVAGCAVVGLWSPLRRVRVGRRPRGRRDRRRHRHPPAVRRPARRRGRRTAARLVRRLRRRRAASRPSSRRGAGRRHGSRAPRGRSQRLPNAVMTTVVLAVATALCVHLMRRTDLTGDVATGAFAFAFGGLVWAAADALSVPRGRPGAPDPAGAGCAGDLAPGAGPRDLCRGGRARWLRSVRWRPPPTPRWPSPSISRWPAPW